MLLAQSAKSTETVVKQEAVNALSSALALALSKAWDEQDTNVSLGAPILQVSNGDSELDEVNATGIGLIGRRAGTPTVSFRSFLTSSGQRLSASTTLGAEGGDLDDIDDYNGQSQSLTVQEASTTGTGDYTDVTLTINYSVNYANDATDYNASRPSAPNVFSAVTSGSTNIKAIRATLSSSNNSDTVITMQAFSCNIGTYRLAERQF